MADYDDDHDEDDEERGCGGKEPERSDSLRTFGAFVKALRQRAGLTQEAWAERSGYSLSTCAGVEQGRRFPPPLFIDRAERELDAGGALREAAKHLSRGPGMAAWFRQWAKMELTALSLYAYDCRMVPGLLQTEAYARALVRQVPPIPPDEEFEQRIALRMERQALFHRKRPVTFSFIIEQALLERQTGAPRSPGNCWTISSNAPVCPTSSCRSCRSCSPSMPVWTGRCTCWRPRRTGGSAMQKVRKRGSCSRTRKLSVDSTCGMQNCAHRLSPRQIP